MSGYRVICTPRRTGGPGSFTAYDNADPSTYWVTQMKLEQKLKGAGKFSFTFLPEHPHADELRRMDGEILVMSGDDVIFCGRPLTDTGDMYNMPAVVCEGNLNWLEDVLDLFSTPPAQMWEYRVGDHEAAVVTYKDLQFDEIVETDDDGNAVYTGIYRHEWTPGDYDGYILPSDEGREYEVIIGRPALDGEGEDAEIRTDGDGNIIYEYKTETVPYERYSQRDKYGNETIYGFLGNLGYVDDTLELRTIKGSSATFYSTSFNPPNGPGELLVQDKELSDAGYSTDVTFRVAIRTRRKMSVQEMFGYMFRLSSQAEIAGINDYNAWCTPSRKLFRGACDIDGETVYDAKSGAKCMDTLKAWEKEFGGYYYTTYEDGRWLINFTKSPGVRDDTVTFAYGENMIDIKQKTDVTKIYTMLEAVGIDDQTGDKFTPGIVTDAEFPAWGGYVIHQAAVNELGTIMMRKEYKIPHQAGAAGEAAMKQALYNAAKADMIDVWKNAEAVSVTAIDPRLIGLSLSGVRVGNRYPVTSPPHGIDYTGDNCLTLNSMTLDLLAPENSKLEFGEERPLLTNYVTGGK